MGNIKAMVIGVSKYFIHGVNDLPFCRNDVIAIRNAFIQGLSTSPKSIITCGLSDVVGIDDLKASLQRVKAVVQSEDILLFYFSGHGTTINGNHYLVLSDTIISTQDLIAFLDEIHAKSKVIFLDCCLAGNFKVDGSAVLNAESAATDFAGRGYAVFASSNASQYSYSHPSKPISLFTSFLCDAVTSKTIIRKGKKSLNDIHKLLFLFFETWEKNNTSCVQTPIYRANIGGTIYFDVEDYTPYLPKEFFYDDEKYYICTVEPLHNRFAKRYVVKVILKLPLTFEEISLVTLRIVEQVKFLNIYSSRSQEEQWNNKPANLIFCYYGLETVDVASGNYICHTTWADATQDKTWWYRIGGTHQKVINGVHFSIHPYYKSLKVFASNHTATKETSIKETKQLLSQMVTSAEYVISQYNELLNKETTEDVFIQHISSTLSKIDELYYEESNLDFPPEELQEWSQLCSNLISDIHNFALFYGYQYFLRQTPENRQQSMNLAINQYYKDLECLKVYESKL